MQRKKKIISLNSYKHEAGILKRSSKINLIKPIIAEDSDELKSEVDSQGNSLYSGDRGSDRNRGEKNANQEGKDD